MAQSPEYPDLKWVPPKSWTDANRTSVQLVVIHTTEGSAHNNSAEDGAAYNARRTDGTSAHYFHDNDSTVHCVRTADQAHTARAQGNRRGIHHELCTRAGSATWGDVYHQALLAKAAKQAARDAKKWGIPVRHLTVAQVADGVKGFCGHWDITRAFPQDGGTHTDPGVNFPWSQFLDLVRAELEEDDMPTAAEIADAVWAKQITRPDGTKVSAGTILAWRDAAEKDTRNQITAAIKDAVAADDNDIALSDEQVGMLAGLVSAQLVKAVNDDAAARLAA